MEIQTLKNNLGIIGTSPALYRAIEVAVRVASTDLSVLITGESGVGKEFFPKIIHMNSARKHNKYIAVNCGAIPEGTIESELFGHEKGAFTGATEARKGYFEEANGGTIFLDEVAELPLTTQVRLLRVLQSGEFIRVGSSKAQKTDVRVIAATNINLSEAIETGKFRSDLYYRLNTVPIQIPALRERKEDILLLFRKFSSDVVVKYGFPPVTLDKKAESLLLNYSWPGNVRQLKNIAEQIATLEQGHEITTDTIKAYLGDFGNDELPMLHPDHRSSSHNSGFSDPTERDILYKLLFELKGEVTELKAMMKNIQNGEQKTTVMQNSEIQSINTPSHDIADNIHEEPTWSEVEEVVDFDTSGEMAPMTKEEKQRRDIIKALQKNNGNRRNAAKELFISERTLYRRIRELDIKY